MDALQDPRFAAVAKDPRFREVPKQERKVKIDKRFQGMFTDKRFKLKYSVDKRGRPENQTSRENLKKFYELEGSDESEDEQEAHSPVQSRTSRCKKKVDRSPESPRKEQLSGQKKRRRSGRELLLEFKRKKTRTPVSPRKSDAIDQDIENVIRQRSRMRPQVEEGAADSDSDDYSASEEEVEEEEEEEEESGLGSDEFDDGKNKNKNKKLGAGSKSGPSSWEKQPGIDLARGEGNVETSSDDDSDSDSEDDDDEDIPAGTVPEDLSGGLSHSWGELDGEAERDEATSNRLAICNLDWDSVTARDLYVLLNSFKPTGGVLHSVKIYPSEFGLEKMREEDAVGPQELVERRGKMEKMDGAEQQRYHMEKLRKYQLQRLKYFYAVVECDSVNTAESIYEQCDGMEYETSASKLDLRFIPDDTTFDQAPRDEAFDAPEAAQYRPMEFQTSALTHSKVQLTWDQDDRRRARQTEDVFRSKKNLEQMEEHIKAYLASSSSEEEEEEEVDYNDDDEEDVEEEEDEDDGDSSSNEDDSEDKSRGNEKGRINKYRDLLKGLDEKEKQAKDDRDMEMEISWEPGLKESTQEIVKKKLETSGSTPWEKYLEKKKDKKKERKEEQKRKRKKEGTEKPDDDEEGAGDYQAFSDDDLPADVDLKDSFFTDSLKTTDKPGTKKKRSKGKKDESKTEEEIKDEKQRKAALELLMLDDDDDDGKQHFNLKSIIENETMTKSKRKRQLKEQRKLGIPAEAAATVQDNFEIDTADPRFQALFSSHEFAIDPSAPQFKKTKAMSSLITEKQRRRQRGEMETGEGEAEEEQTKEGGGGGGGQGKKKDVELSQLVRSIKSKTQEFHSRKKLKGDS